MDKLQIVKDYILEKYNATWDIAQYGDFIFPLVQQAKDDFKLEVETLIELAYNKGKLNINLKECNN